MNARALVVATSLTAVAAAVAPRALSPVVGILEHQCGESGALVVRPLFAKAGADWVALGSRERIARAISPEMTWSIALDGASLGALRTIALTMTAGNDEHVARDAVLPLAPGQRPPRRTNPGGRFDSWCGAVQNRPLVVVAPANFRDPERWKPFQPSSELRTTLLPAFRRLVDSVVICPANPEKHVPFHYGARNLRIVSAYRDRHARRIVAIELNPAANGCDGPPGPDWANHWFLLDPRPRYLGESLQLVDAGDYDADGRSELLFWYSGYNRAGYSLFADDFTTRVDRWWGYH